MKNKAIISTCASLLLLTTTVVSAAVTPDIAKKVNAAGGSSSQVRVIVNNATVSIHGYVEDSNALIEMERVARKHGAERVFNYAIRSK